MHSSSPRTTPPGMPTTPSSFPILPPPLSSPRATSSGWPRHTRGGKYGSLGYSGKWEICEAQKNILRTHTTCVSTRSLYELARKSFRPAKLFSIDKVFRNESVDSTHLAEFHQVEGLIAGKGLTLGHLMGVLQEFFDKLGMGDIKFKPAYNPYTEPSMEVFGFHKGLGRWIEVGNSGVFRPEMLMPMGFDSDVRVIAWGLSLERPTMIKYDLKNIRELVGHKVDLEFAKNSAFCYFG
jgi:phenylalanyl-tRNA synthetase alpha chain